MSHTETELEFITRRQAANLLEIGTEAFDKWREKYGSEFLTEGLYREGKKVPAHITMYRKNGRLMFRKTAIESAKISRKTEKAAA